MTKRYSLDLNHGFLKAIVKNQIDRDEYDQLMKTKALKCAKNKGKVLHYAKPSKPELNLYIPPHRKAIAEEPYWDEPSNGAILDKDSIDLIGKNMADKLHIDENSKQCSSQDNNGGQKSTKKPEMQHYIPPHRKSR